MPVNDIWTRPLFPSLFDMTVMGFYLVLMFLIANHIRSKNIDRNPVYKFYTWGLLAKVAGAIAMGLVYTLYYDGGDTTAYYVSSEVLVNLLFREPLAFFRIVFGDKSPEVYSFFTAETGWPMYWGKPESFIVVQFTWPFTLLGFGNYFTAAILFAWFFYGGFWKLYLLATRIYPAYAGSFALAVLFVPSVLFWSSGISKDTITLAATGWFVYSFYFLFIERRKILNMIFLFAISTALLLLVKPYVFVAVGMGGFIWLAWTYLKKIHSLLLRAMLMPLMVAVFFGTGLLFMSIFQPFLGEYGSLDGIIHKAITTYEDHIRAGQYGEHFYYLGQFDGTRWNFFSKAPAALVAGLFRPFIWEAGTLFMLLAALENTAFLMITLVIIWRTGPVKALKIAFEEPLAIFALTVAATFAFGVGISTANFGALMRLKTPYIPFLLIGLLVLYNKVLDEKKSATR